MAAGRYGIGFVVIVAGSLLASALATRGMVSIFEWLTDNSASPGHAWLIGLSILRVLFIPAMLVLAITIVRRAIRIRQRRIGVSPRTANMAILYYGIMVCYISLGMAAPLFWAVVPVVIEPIIYPAATMFLLVATVRALQADEGMQGHPALSPPMAAALLAAGLAIALGASLAYWEFVPARGSIECFGGECPTERTLAVTAFMGFSAIAAAAAVGWGMRSSIAIDRWGVTGSLAFACLAAFFPLTVMPAFVMPYDAFAPGFFYGIAAVAFLIVALARKDSHGAL